MKREEVVELIRAGIPDAELLVDGEDCSFSVVVISPSFAGQSMLKKQQAVLATVSAQLATGELHAMTAKCYTPEEWQVQLNKTSEGLVVL